MIRYLALCKIVELGSFTKAAQALGYTQAAISQMISSLENEYSFNLLIRTRNGVRLTQEGESIYPLIQKSIYIHQDLKDRVNEIKGLSNGEIRIGTFSSISQHWLPRLIKAFNELYPNINFVIHQGDNISIPEWIKTNKVDFGFISYEKTPDLILTELVEDPYYAILPKGHRLCGKDRIDLHDLEHEKLLLVEEGTYSTTMQKFNEMGLSPEVKFRIQDDYTIFSMIEQNFGVSVMSGMVLKHTSYDLEAILTEPPISRKIFLAHQNPDLMTIAAHKFINFMCEKLPELKGESDGFRITYNKTTV